MPKSYYRIKYRHVHMINRLQRNFYDIHFLVRLILYKNPKTKLSHNIEPLFIMLAYKAVLT